MKVFVPWSKIMLVICILFGIGRIYIGFTIPPETPDVTDFFKTAAHLLIGGLIGAQFIKHERWRSWLIWPLSILELTVAIVSRL